MQYFQIKFLLFLYIVISGTAVANEQNDIYDGTHSPIYTWTEKYLIYEQSQNEAIRKVDDVFLTEIVYLSEDGLRDTRAEIRKLGSDASIAKFNWKDHHAHSNNRYYTRKVKSFDSLERLETAHPPDSQYVWTLEIAGKKQLLLPVRIGGEDAQSQFPLPSPIRLFQKGEKLIGSTPANPSLDLMFSFDPFTVGGYIEGAPRKDLTFLLVDNCRGETVFTSGIPGHPDGYLDYTKNKASMSADRLEPGMVYTVFISQLHMVDYQRSEGIDQFAWNSYANERHFKTAGQQKEGSACPRPPIKADYRFSRKTKPEEGMTLWPTVADKYGTVKSK